MWIILQFAMHYWYNLCAYLVVKQFFVKFIVI